MTTIIHKTTYDRWKRYAEEMGDDYISEADFEEWVNRQIEIAEELL